MTKQYSVNSSADKRILIASIFVVILLGIAFDQMFSVMIPLLKNHTLQFGDITLCLIFLITTFRFFIGNQLHLLNEEVVMLRGVLWMYDLLMITLQTLMLVVLGSMSVLHSNEVRPDFFSYICVLYGIDIFWILSIWLIGVLVPHMRRATIPWPWLILNLVLTVCIVITQSLFDSVYEPLPLMILAFMNGIAFLLDILLIDIHRVLDAPVK
jgi:hypothetical protein